MVVVVVVVALPKVAIRVEKCEIGFKILSMMVTE